MRKKRCVLGNAVFKVDQPFIYYIRITSGETEGNILFCGRLNEPPVSEAISEHDEL